MKKLLYTLIMLVGLWNFNYAQQTPNDATIATVSTQEPILCSSGLNTTIYPTVHIIDAGTNGVDTDYEWSNPDGGLTLTGNLTGTVPDGSYMLSISISVTLDTANIGDIKIVRLTTTPTGGGFSKSVDFKVTINDVPAVLIQTPDGTESCNGNLIQLQAVLPSGVTAGYNWTPGGETTASIYITNADTYTVNTSNACGTGSASKSTTAEITPNLTIDLCQNANDQLTFRVTATDNDNAGITVTFHENNPSNPALTTGGDYTVSSSGNQHTLVVNNVNPAHNNTNYYAKAVNSCGTTTSIACLALPIELVYFRARSTAEGVLLEWATATETNNDFFTIERSTDGQNFKPIVEIEGAGTTYFTREYDFLDKEALLLKGAETLYYRLKQTDFDGAFSYSDLVTVQIDGHSSLDIAAVSLRQDNVQLQFQLQSQREGQALLSIYRLDGQKVFDQTLLVSKGLQTYQLELPEALGSGMYLLRIENGYQAALKKFVSLR